MVFSLMRFQGHMKSVQQTSILVVELAGDPIPDTTPPAASISRGSGAVASSRWRRRRSETARRGAPAAICGVVSPRSNQFGTGCPIARRAKRRRRPTRRSVRGYRVRVMEKEEFRATQSPYAENRTCGGVGGCRGAIPSTRPDRRIPNDSRMRPFPGFITEKPLTAASLECCMDAVR